MTTEKTLEGTNSENDAPQVQKLDIIHDCMNDPSQDADWVLQIRNILFAQMIFFFFLHNGTLMFPLDALCAAEPKVK